MRLLFVADGRSPIALNWISHFVDANHEVHLVSTFPCQPDLSLASLQVIPVAFAAAAGGGTPSSSGLRRLVPVGLRTAIRQRLGPFTLPSAARRLGEIIAPYPTRPRPRPAHPLRGHARRPGPRRDSLPAPGHLRVGQRFHPARPRQRADAPLHPPGVIARRCPAGGLPPRPAPGWRLGLRPAETICRPARRGRRAARPLLPAPRR